jgi:hypothetical protein
MIAQQIAHDLDHQNQSINAASGRLEREIAHLKQDVHRTRLDAGRLKFQNVEFEQKIGTSFVMPPAGGRPVAGLLR